MKHQEELLNSDDEMHTKTKDLSFWERNQYITYFLLLMCQEWGDRSQVSAIALAANYGALGIIVGGGLAHCLCIMMALALGKMVEKALSESLLNLMGGLLFLTFGFYELFFNYLYVF